MRETSRIVALCARAASGLVPALVLGLAATAALAQEPAQPEGKGGRVPRVAVIDMGRVSAESLIGKGYAAQLEGLKNEIDAEGTKKQAELQKLDAQIKALQDELEKQGSVLSPEAAERKRLDIVKKGRERQAFLEDGQAELQRMRERAQQQAQALNAEFQQRIRPHIDAVSKERGVDVLIEDQLVLFLNKEFDLSQDVIVKADDAERTAKGKGAPRAGEKPAAKPGAPAPTPTPTPSPQPQT